jgi:hypothetical protein
MYSLPNHWQTIAIFVAADASGRIAGNKQPADENKHD